MCMMMAAVFPAMAPCIGMPPQMCRMDAVVVTQDTVEQRWHHAYAWSRARMTQQWRPFSYASMHAWLDSQARPGHHSHRAQSW